MLEQFQSLESRESLHGIFVSSKRDGKVSWVGRLKCLMHMSDAGEGKGYTFETTGEVFVVTLRHWNNDVVAHEKNFNEVCSPTSEMLFTNFK